MTSNETNPRAKRKLIIDILAMLFGISSWIGMNSIFNEMPLLLSTTHIPEGKKIWSYVSMIVQLANIGPVIYTLIRKFTKVTEEFCIYAMIIFIIIVDLVLSFTYDSTAVILGEEYSVMLLLAVFILSLHGCTSSVLYIPYMRHFSQIYIATFMFGEGLSSLVPSTIALSQGSGNNETHNPRFSVQIFFILQLPVLVISFVAFYFLNTLPTCKYDREMVDMENRPKKDDDTLVADEISEKVTLMNNTSTTGVVKLISLIATVFFLNAYANGFMYTLQIYSASKYNKDAYYWMVTLGSLASTSGSFAAIFLSKFFTWLGVYILLAILVVLGAFTTVEAIVTTSLFDVEWGSWVIVILWISIFCMLSFTKSCLMSLLRTCDKRALYWGGIATQSGSFSGATVNFFLVNFTNLFHKK